MFSLIEEIAQYQSSLPNQKNKIRKFQTQLQLHSCCMMTCAITGGHDTLPRDHHHVRNGHPQPVQLPLPTLPPPKPPHRIFGMRGSDIDKYSRVLFPIMFVRWAVSHQSQLNYAHFSPDSYGDFPHKESQRREGIELIFGSFSRLISHYRKLSKLTTVTSLLTGINNSKESYSKSCLHSARW